MVKSPEMENALNSLALAFFGRSRKECFANSACVMCGGPALEFRNELSQKEYSISCMCQTCQDDSFGK